MEKRLSILLIACSVLLAGIVYATDSSAPGERAMTLQEKQVIESIEKGSSAALPETGAGMSRDSASDCD